MEDACFNPHVESFVMNSYLEKLVMHQLSSSNAFLSFTFIFGDFFIFFQICKSPYILAIN